MRMLSFSSQLFKSYGVQMKSKKWTLAMVFAISLVAGTERLEAHENHDHGTEAKKTREIMSSHDGMTAVYAQIAVIESEINAGDLKSMHEITEAIQVSTQDLSLDKTLDATRKKRVEGYVVNVKKLVDKMHDAADAKKMDQAKKEFTKLKTQVDLLDKQFAHSHKPVPATTETH